MKWILPLSSALLLALSFETPYLWWFSLFGFIPFLIFLERLQISNNDSKSNKQRDALFGGWLLGLVYFALIFRWVLYAFPADWAGLNSSLTSIPLFGISWLGTSIVISFSSALFGLLALRFLSQSVFIIPSLWVLSEYIRAWLFGLFLWGEGATLGPYWSFGNLGFSLIDTPAILWSRIIGLYGVSFLVVLINVLVFRFFIRKDVKIISLVSVFLIVFFLPKIFFPIHIQKDLLHIALVHTNLSIGFLGEKEFTTLWGKTLTGNNTIPAPNIVVFPEGASLFADDNSDKSLLREIFSDKDKLGLIITSRTVSTSQGLKEEIVYRNQEGEFLSVQEKSFLIPAGEYLPFVLKSFIRLFEDSSVLERFNLSRTHVKGKEIETPVTFGDIEIGTLLCSGITSPLLYRSLADSGANVLVNSASQIIFQNQPFFLLQAKMFARFQAIANERPFLQASNGGQSFAIDQNGEVIQETKSFKNQILTMNIFPSKVKTLYTRFGDWPLLLMGVFIIYVIFRNRRFQ